MSVGLDVRPATAADADSIAALFELVYGGSYPFADSIEPDRIRRIVTGADHLWMLVLEAGTVVGSVMARRDPGNASYELGRGVVHPDHRGRPEPGMALDSLLRDTMARPDCELLYGEARSERARRKLGRAGALRYAWTGTSGGRYVVLGEREDHLFGMAFNAERVVTRIVPSRSVLLPGSPVACEIGRLRSVNRVGAYPDRISSRGVGGYIHESDRGRVTYSAFESSRSAVVSAVDAETPGDVRRVLWEILDGAAPANVEHLTLHALADKLPVIQELCRFDPDDPARRFAVRGYRPGWHKDGAARYDCVTLTAQVSVQTPNRNDLGPLVNAVHRSFPARLC